MFETVCFESPNLIATSVWLVPDDHSAINFSLVVFLGDRPNRTIFTNSLTTLDHNIATCSRILLIAQSKPLMENTMSRRNGAMLLSKEHPV